MTTQTFTVIATNDFGETSTEVSIEITNRSPQIVVPIPSLEWVEGEEFKPVDFAGFFDGAGMTFASPDLPEGFTLSNDGVLSRP